MKPAETETSPTLRQCLSVFVFLGPAIGFLATVVQFVVVSYGGPEELLGGVALGAMVFPLVYALGSLPMLLAGLGYWAVRRVAVVVAIPISASALIGGSLAAMPVAFFFSFALPGPENILAALPYCIPGAVAAIACAVVCGGRRTHVSRKEKT